MDKNQLQQALKEGCTMRHFNFLPTEYIYLEDGILKDENGYHLTDFWSYRQGEIWETGWSYHTETRKVKDLKSGDKIQDKDGSQYEVLNGVNWKDGTTTLNFKCGSVGTYSQNEELKIILR